MHEFALAEAVIVAALEAGDKEGLSKLSRIEVHVGELQQIKRETFEFALNEVLPGDEPRLAGVEVQVEIVPAQLRCKACDNEFDLNQSGTPDDAAQREAIHFIPELARSFLKCPACGSPDFEVVAGRGVSIRRIEGE